MNYQYLLRLESLLVQQIEILNKQRISKSVNQLILRKDRIRYERLRLKGEA